VTVLVDQDGDVWLDHPEKRSEEARKQEGWRVVIVTVSPEVVAELAELPPEELALLESRVREDMLLAIGADRERRRRRRGVLTGP
jgi:hypothetical protein